MKLRLSCMLLTLALSAAQVPASAASSDEDTLVALEHAWIEAAQTHDVTTLNALIDDSYVAETPKGRRNKQDQLAVMSPGVTQKLSDLSVNVSGDTATVAGENQITNIRGAIKRFKFTDKFIRRNDTWVAVHSYVTE